ncbi:YhcN/YlaJ family sporulation lipoprotein [Paenibacillus castaneae]|uniref:YhcN/YlaJ family sporulation lipoprotein n=1 Tax=Paenibacillus castaneae TaxID=474957 RepID=UPI000C9AB45A|nr:YhcN/YlaJ family sporulation lipoprotein [Paenibacillus castaneae]NIK76927.1 YhcN/YlaJ family sporulation lipoprotein [Paenibacillus castaneae]
MRKKLAVLSAGVLLSTMLAGCMANHGELGNKDIRSNSIRYDANGNILSNKRFANDQSNEMNRMYGRRMNSNNIVGSHKNYRMEMNEKIAENINRMDEVKASYVMMTDRNAYVAVSLDQGEHNINSKMMSRTNTSKEGAKLSRQMSSLSTGHHMLTDQLKDKISQDIKRVKPTVEHVYVSANPDFVGRMNAYMNDVKLGRPIQGYIAEFNAMVERVFPAKPSENGLKSMSIKNQTYIYD